MDHVDLPGGFGEGTSTEALWIINNLKREGAEESGPSANFGMGGDDSGPSANFGMGGEEPVTYHSSSGVAYPMHWGAPPQHSGMGLMDHVDLPGGFGEGTSTEALWIINNLKRDGAEEPEKS